MHLTLSLSVPSALPLTLAHSPSSSPAIAIPSNGSQVERYGQQPFIGQNSTSQFEMGSERRANILIGSSATDDMHCPLLELPAEIRNRIYREVLLSPEPVQVTENNYQQPSLLRTCSQIRSEASSIYYIESEFELVLENFDTTPATSWFRHARGYNEKMSIVWDGIENGGKWSNLLTWLRREYESKIVGFRLGKDAPLSERQGTEGQVSRLFDQLEILKGMPWDKVRRVLEKHREAVIGCGKPAVLGSDDRDP